MHGIPVQVQTRRKRSCELVALHVEICQVRQCGELLRQRAGEANARELQMRDGGVRASDGAGDVAGTGARVRDVRHIPTSVPLVTICCVEQRLPRSALRFGQPRRAPYARLWGWNVRTATAAAAGTAKTKHAEGDGKNENNCDKCEDAHPRSRRGTRTRTGAGCPRCCEPSDALIIATIRPVVVDFEGLGLFLLRPLLCH